MSSDRRSPWWPYLLLLAGLFVLSLAVPRGWQTATVTENPEPPPQRSAIAKRKPHRVRPVVVQPMPPERSVVAQQIAAKPVEPPHHQTPIPVELAAPPSTVAVDNSNNLLPFTEMVAQKIADARRFLGNRRLPKREPAPPTDAAPQPALASKPAPQPERASLPPGPKIPAVDRSRSPAQPKLNTPTLPDAPTEPSQEATASVVETPTPTPAPAATWPAPESLLAQLDSVSQHVECRDWAVFAKQLCETLAATPVEQPKQAKAILGQLHSLSAQADSVAGQLKDPLAAAEFRRVQYALQRRLGAWDLAATAGARPTAYANVLAGEEQRRQLVAAAADVQTYLRGVPHGDAWANYLALDDVARLAAPGSAPNEDEARLLARRILLRTAPRQITAAQRRVLSDKSIQAFAEQLKPLAAESIEHRQLMSEIERYESSRLPSDAETLVAVEQRLAWSPDATDQQLAQHLENHYRNANVRVAFTAELLDRLAPEPITSYDRVNDVIVGTPVHGQSVNTTKFQVRLIPDPRRVHFWLEANGEVFSNTHSSSGPATLSNRGVAQFIVHKAVVLDERGLGIARASTEADTHSHLTGIHTNFDGIPVLGAVVRNIAESQYEELQEKARWEARQKIAGRAGRQVDAQVNQRLQAAEDRVKQQVITPLVNMGLELEPITMETQTERATMRLRLAGAHQLGGHTARPQAPSDSLASVQLHESALNNVLDQLQLAGRTFELAELYKHLAARLSRPQPALPADLPEGVFITFAEHDPLRVRCDDGHLQLTLAVKELRQGSRQWHDFSITTNYKAEINGRQATLVRDGIIDLDGEAYRGKTEFALRGIFSKILSRERKFDLVPPLVVDQPHLADLEITQCVIEDGWIGIALGPDRTAPRSDMARHPATTLRK